MTGLRKNPKVLVAALAALTVSLAPLATPASAAEPAAEMPANAAAEPDCYVPPNADVNVIKIVYSVGVKRNVTGKIMLAAFEAGWVESHMNNLNCGTYDSVGVFQQRPSQGWCDRPAQCMNVHHASRKFFERAEQLAPGCRCTAGELAQAVQVSAYPDRYDRAEAKARQLISRAASLVRPWPTLRPGSRGPNVRTLQLLLQQRGYYIAADGVFGPNTRQAVNTFKRRNGLTPDGIVAHGVWTKIVPRLAPGANSKAVAAAKVQLNKHNGNLNPSNHHFGQRMAQVVLYIKVAEGLVRNSVIATKTWRYFLGRPAGV